MRKDKLLGIGIVAVLLLASLAPLSLGATDVVEEDLFELHLIEQGGRDLSPIEKLFSYLYIFGESDFQLSKAYAGTGECIDGNREFTHPTTNFKKGDKVYVLLRARDVRAGADVELLFMHPDGTWHPAEIVGGGSTFGITSAIDYDVWQVLLTFTAGDEGGWRLKAVEHRASEITELAEVAFTVVGSDIPNPPDEEPSLYTWLVVFWDWITSFFLSITGSTTATPGQAVTYQIALTGVSVDSDWRDGAYERLWGVWTLVDENKVVIEGGDWTKMGVSNYAATPSFNAPTTSGTYYLVSTIIKQTWVYESGEWYKTDETEVVKESKQIKVSIPAPPDEEPNLYDWLVKFWDWLRELWPF